MGPTLKRIGPVFHSGREVTALTGERQPCPRRTRTRTILWFGLWRYRLQQDALLVDFIQESGWQAVRIVYIYNHR